jgi:hypothetical protein
VNVADRQHAPLGYALISLGGAVAVVAPILVKTAPKTHWTDALVLFLLTAGGALIATGLLLHFGWPRLRFGWVKLPSRVKLPSQVGERLDDFAWWVRGLGRFSPIVWRGLRHHHPPLDPEQARKRAEMWQQMVNARAKEQPTPQKLDRQTVPTTAPTRVAAPPTEPATLRISQEVGALIFEGDQLRQELLDARRTPAASRLPGYPAIGPVAGRIRHWNGRVAALVDRSPLPFKEKIDLTIYRDAPFGFGNPSVEVLGELIENNMGFLGRVRQRVG